jgi:single-strand DNA-binding protein
MNRCIFTAARLTKDPDVKYTQDGKAIARFGIAVNKEYKVPEGQPTADFLNCVAFGKTAEFVEKYFRKGSKINLEARAQSGSYTNKEGQKVYTLDFIVNNVEFCNDKNSSDNGAAPASATVPAASDGEFMNIPEGIDEELPFN